MEDNLPNCCYDYRFDKYEDGRKLENDDYYAEREDMIYEQNRDEC